MQFLNHHNPIVVPDWKKESQWRSMLPQGNTYLDFTHWWLSWRRLGAECDLRPVDWNHQFNACMNHKGYFSKYLQKLVEIEVCEGTTWDLERRQTFMANKLMIAFKAQETLHPSHEDQSVHKKATCFKCGGQGHYASHCLNKGLKGSRPAARFPNPARTSSSVFVKVGGG